MSISLRAISLPLASLLLSGCPNPSLNPLQGVPSRVKLHFLDEQRLPQELGEKIKLSFISQKSNGVWNREKVAETAISGTYFEKDGDYTSPRTFEISGSALEDYVKRTFNNSMHSLVFSYSGFNGFEGQVEDMIVPFSDIPVKGAIEGQFINLAGMKDWVDGPDQLSFSVQHLGISEEVYAKRFPKGSLEQYLQDQLGGPYSPSLETFLETRRFAFSEFSKAFDDGTPMDVLPQAITIDGHSFSRDFYMKHMLLARIGFFVEAKLEKSALIALNDALARQIPFEVACDLPNLDQDDLKRIEKSNASPIDLAGKHQEVMNDSLFHIRKIINAIKTQTLAEKEVGE